MIILDKSLSANTIYVTATEVGVNISSGCTISAYNLSTNVLYSLSLSNDLSPYPERYNEYTITSGLTQLPIGRYSYILKNTSGVVLEEGILDCITEEETQTEQVDNLYIYQQEPNTIDDYLVNL